MSIPHVPYTIPYILYIMCVNICHEIVLAPALKSQNAWVPALPFIRGMTLDKVLLSSIKWG